MSVMPHRNSTIIAALLFVSACTGAGGEARPHIILVTSDTLRADHLSLHGYARATSPRIDGFASQAWQFRDAVTVIPKTGPSFATIFTGRHPQQHGVRSNFGAIPTALPVLAERLRALGYRTAAFVGNPVLRPGAGFDRGFEHYQLFDGRHGAGTGPVNAAFLEWARADWDRPTFVWIHYMDPHGPYTPRVEVLRPFLEDELARSEARVALAPAEMPSGNADKVLGAVPAYQRIDDEDRVAVYVARYDAEIHQMDEAFGELLDHLERRGLYDASAIVFTSDHGESLGEHDYFFEHGWFADEAELHVPLIIKPPAVREGRVVEQQVTHLDLLPTFLALAKAPPDREGSGADLLGSLADRGPVLIENSDRYPEKFYGLRGLGFKYLVREGDRVEELYDLRADPREQRNLAAEQPDRLRELRRACDEALLRARASALPQASVAPEDPQTLERLRGLGYVGE